MLIIIPLVYLPAAASCSSYSITCTSQINCLSGSNVEIGTVEEEYSGDVEIVTNIQPSDVLVLEPYAFPIGLTFVELVHSPGAPTATIRTTKPLDADQMKESGGTLYYSIACTNSGVKNYRTLDLIDINDNAPVFEKKEYTISISEITPVNSDVLKVLAVDADFSPEFSRVTYSIQPPAPAEFQLRSDGTIRLISRLNYNIASVYSFTIEAADVGNLKDTASVVINIEDFDNLNPYFDHSLYQASILENEVGELTVGPDAIKAQDGDTGINEPVVYSITAVNPAKYLTNFEINPNSGVISVRTALDREEIETITIQIQAEQQDDSTKAASSIVFLTVEDVNDNPPEFDQSEYATVIPENSPNGMLVLQATVTDLDQGGFVGTLRLVPDTVPFSISPDGSIRVKTSAELDRETISSFAFEIEAKDTPPANFTATASVNITLSDENDNSPEFGQTTYEGEVPIDQTVGMLVVKVEATDPDEGPNGQVTYSIDFGNYEDYFSIDENTGSITLTKTIPLQPNRILQFLLYVTAKDGGAVSRSSSTLVDIKAPGESHPQFIDKPYHGRVEEEQEPGAEIVKVSFLSVAPIVSVTLTVETEADKFSIDQVTGMLSTKVKLDYETQKNYTVQVSLTDGTNLDEALIYVEVLDINDNSPVFDPIPSSIEIPEDAAIGDNVTTVSATDADSGLNGEVRYSLEGSAGIFSVNPDTGLITVAAKLDRETQDTYSFRAVAQDQGRPTLSGEASLVVTITDVNDNAPIFTKQQYETFIKENATIGTDVTSVSATDKDEGLNAVVSYYITKQEPPSSPEIFTINATSGSISLAQELDYSKVKRYTLEVEGRDHGSPSLTGTAVVVVWVEDVNDTPLHFLHRTYHGKVEEEQEPGVEIVEVSFLSVSPIVSVTLTVETEADKFSIDQVTGMLSTKVKLDYETQKNYTVQVSLTDGTNRDEALVYVEVLDINDNSPVFDPIPSSIEIPEDAAIGDNVTTVLATDADSGLNGEVRYSLEGSAGMFSVNPDTGLITVAAKLDRETQDKYSFRAVAQDQGRPTLSGEASLVVTITDVNDNAPIFTKQQYETFIKENATIGTDVTSVSATDKDEGLNAVVLYYITKQEPPSSPEIFTINATSGSISLAQELDYSKVKRYTLEVEGRDHGSPSLTGTAVVEVWVEDVNNNPPKFSQDLYNVAVYENIDPGSALVSLEVTDEDEGGFSKGFFLLTSDIFSINAQGVVHLRNNASLDRETKDNYLIQVVAVDQPVDGLSSTAQVNITVLDINDNNPQFIDLQNPLEIPEDFMGEVYRIDVTDADIGPNGEVTVFTMSHIDLFSITRERFLTVIGELDRETKDLYELFIMAKDNGEPSRNNVTTMTIIVTDVNDNDPVFTEEIYSTRVLAKEVKKGDLVLVVTATDRDIGNNSLISYRFSSGSDLVDLHPETGAITWTRDLTEITEDMELDLTVLAEDHGVPSRNGTAKVLIEIRANSLSEELSFENSTYSLKVKENEPVGTEVGVVTAISGSQTVQVDYKLTSNSDLFSIDKSGTIRTLQSLDKEELEWYIFKVEATDSRTPPTTAVTTVMVQVEDVNEPPVFDVKTYRTEILSVAPFKYPVVTLKATDPDVGDTEELQFSLQGSSSLLAVESSTGLVYVLDLTEMGGQVITAQVRATDKQGLYDTAQLQVNVKPSSTEDIVIIALNQPIHSVEQKIQETQSSLQKVLGWTVNILSLRSESGSEMRSLLKETTSKTYISFVATDKDGVTVHAKDVHEKLKSERELVKAELEKVFGSGLVVEELVGGSGGSAESDEAVIITLGVLLGLSMVGLIVLVVVGVIRFRKMKDGEDSDKESFNIGKKALSVTFTNEEVFISSSSQEDGESYSSSRKVSDTSEKGITTVAAF
ncbi:protocadherin Fat 4 isoform X2 [Astyanax mexicanus]|uniref:protocadherin Fat 4 isoform X2 n=1 Tax=Astyanax mexicanus TaxID=7994 RepID=UPI0020CB4107|nr:protocadherin Fat 4 isoform X2 [Astyanax mexicanus]